MKKIVIRPERCTGCRSCEAACSKAHAREMGPPGRGRPKAVPRIRVESHKKSGSTVLSPARCRQCERPPCAEACPQGALSKGEDGVVVHDPDKCVGCLECIIACPYGSIHLEGTRPVKCDMCPDRSTPACVAACRNGAMFIQWEEVQTQELPFDGLIGAE